MVLLIDERPEEMLRYSDLVKVKLLLLLLWADGRVNGFGFGMSDQKGQTPG